MKFILNESPRSILVAKSLKTRTSLKPCRSKYDQTELKTVIKCIWINIQVSEFDCSSLVISFVDFEDYWNVFQSSILPFLVDSILFMVSLLIFKNTEINNLLQDKFWHWPVTWWCLVGIMDSLGVREVIKEGYKSFPLLIITDKWINHHS